MQAIRVLRAQSRPASPAPPPPAANANANANASAADTSPKRLIQQIANEDAVVVASPRPNSAMARIQSLAPFHKRVAPTPPPSPRLNPSTIVQDGTYLNTLGLRLNEAATRSLAPTNGTGIDSWKGKKPLQPGRGRQFAVLIETELEASQGNANLRQAIIRLLPRSLSVIVSSLSSQVSQSTATPGYVPSTVMTSPHASTLHALGLATFAGEILETFTNFKLSSASNDLGAIKGHLETIITLVTAPLFAQMQVEITALLEPLGQMSNFTSSVTGMTASPSLRPLELNNSKPGKPHPTVATLAQYIPYFAKALRRCTVSNAPGTQTALASFLIKTIWQALIRLSHRPPPTVPSITLPGHASATHKISAASLALSQISLTPPQSPPTTNKKLTPPNSPPSTKRLVSLPGGGGNNLDGTESPPKSLLRLKRVPSSSSTKSRAASPDVSSVTAQSQTTNGANGSAICGWLSSILVDTRAVVDLLLLPDMPKPVEASLAREAADEAMESLVCFRDWIAFALANASPAPVRGTISAPAVLSKLMETVPEELPLLVVLPILLGLCWLLRPAPAPAGKDEEELAFPGMGRLIGYDSEDVYRRGVLAGFRRAEECETVIVRCILTRLTAAGTPWAENVRAWLDAKVIRE